MQKNTDHRIVLLDIMADGSLKMTLNENYGPATDLLEEICDQNADSCTALITLLEMSGYNESGYGYRYGYEVINPAALCLDPNTPIIGQFDLNDGHPQHVGEYERIFVYNPGSDEDGQMCADWATVLLSNGEVWFGSPAPHTPPTKSRLYQMAKELHALIAAGNVDRDTAQEIADMVEAMKSQATPTQAYLNLK